MLRLTVSIKPGVLNWARESAGYSVGEIAKWLKVSEHKVKNWESGNEELPYSKLEKLANKYKRPVALFFLTKPPKEMPLPKDFRTLPDEDRDPLSPETRLAMRRARRLQLLSAELAKNLGYQTTTKTTSINPSENPEIVALKIRSELGVDVREQFSWRDEYKALAAWKIKIEQLGIFVFQLSMPIEETRGFSFTDTSPPSIVINKSDAVNGRIFSLFHEYAHILINDGGFCDMADRDFQSKEALTERFCNSFSGAFLVPKDNLLNHNLVKQMKRSVEWPEEELQQLARDFKVSREVILRRLVLLGYASARLYERKREEWKLELEQFRHDLKEQRAKAVWKRSIPRECIREKSLPFVSLVLDALGKEKITYSEASDYLGVRVKYIDPISHLARRRSLI